MTYRAVLANREFAALLVGQGLSTIGDQLARIAIAILVFERTGSALAASATYAVSFLTYLLGGPVLSAVSDRYPRAGVMVMCDVLRAPAILVLCAPDVPLWAYFVVLVVVGLMSPPFDSARSGLQPDLLPGDQYVVGNGLMNLVLQFGQVLGFLAGGALVGLVSARGALAIDAASFLISAGFVLACVVPRRAAQDRADRGRLLTDTRKGVSLVRSSPALRRYLFFSVLTSAAVITPEGLAVPVSRALHSDNVMAGFLTAAIPAGTVIGGLVVLRLSPERRLVLLPHLSLLCTVPLLVTPLINQAAMLVALWCLAGLGNCVTLIAAAAYMQACPPEFRSRAYGVAVTLLQATQGVALLVSGWLAGPVGTRGAVALVAAVVVLGLAGLPVLRATSEPQGVPHFVRGNAR
ncbi:MAG: transporter [Frankiales bacterium]|nr:transporter [Frankiales bacterium]